MTDQYKPLLDRDFLRSELHGEYLNYRDALDTALLERLTRWHASGEKRETQAEDSFTQRFFVETWGYRQTGTGGEFELLPKFMIPGAGAGGQAGEADLVVGLFGSNRPPIPQVVCEYKGVGTDLDAPQPRKGNTRSPVQQAADYLRGAARGVFPGAPVQPRWALVTDMNAFRLYWGSGEPDRFLRFTLTQTDLFSGTTLLGTDERARFDRFLFWRLFRPDMLLADGGRPRLERLIEKQGSVSKKLEGRFYEDYRRFRKLLRHCLPLCEKEGLCRGVFYSDVSTGFCFATFRSRSSQRASRLNERARLKCPLPTPLRTKFGDIALGQRCANPLRASRTASSALMSAFH